MARPEVIGPFEVGGIDGAELRALRQIVRQLASESPEVDEEAVRAALVEGLRRTAGARVQNYRLVLAERWARSRLRGDADRPVAGPLIGASAGSPLELRAPTSESGPEVVRPLVLIR